MRNPVLIFQLQDRCLLGIVCSIKSGNWRIERDFTITLDASGDHETGSAWADLLRTKLNDKKKDSVHSCLWILHRSDYAVLNLELPAGTSEETAAMLELELADRLPADLAKICFGWDRVDTSEDGQQILQVYWAPQSRILPIYEALKHAGLELTGILPALALYRPLIMNPAPDHPTALLYVEGGNYELAGWDPRGIISFSRGKKSLLGENESSELNSGALEADLRKKLQQLSAQFPPDAEPRLVRLHAAAIGPEAEAELKSSVSGGLQELVKSLKNPCREKFFPLAAVVIQAPLLFGRTASENSSLTLNMLPRQVVQRSEREQFKRLAIRVAILLTGIVALLVGNAVFYLHELRTQLAGDQMEIKRLTPVAKDIEAMEARIVSINDQLDYAISPVEALKAVNAILANASDILDGLFLDHMTYAATGEIVMEGHAINDITPWKFAEELGKSGAFRILQKPKIEWHMFGGTRSIRFNLKVQASPHDDGQIPAGGAKS